MWDEEVKEEVSREEKKEQPRLVVDLDKIEGTLDLSAQKPRKCWIELSWQKGNAPDFVTTIELDNYGTSNIELGKQIKQDLG